jgi:hypothetical protein
LGFGFTDEPAASLTVLPAVVSGRWENGLRTRSTSRNAAVWGTGRRQSKTTGLLQEHTDLAAAMPASRNGQLLFHELLAGQ